jgi:hypothetical protein
VLANKMSANSIIGKLPILSGQAINLLAILVFEALVQLPTTARIAAAKR